MTDVKSDVLSAMTRGSEKRQRAQAADIQSHIAAATAVEDKITAEVDACLAALPSKSFEAAEAGEELVVAHKIADGEIDPDYNVLSEGRDNSDGLEDTAKAIFDKLAELGLQPEIYHGGELDFAQYGDAFYITIPMQETIN